MAKAVQTLSALEKDTKHVSLLTDLTQEAVGLRTRARLMLDELSTVSSTIHLLRPRLTFFDRFLKATKQPLKGYSCSFSHLWFKVMKNLSMSMKFSR